MHIVQQDTKLNVDVGKNGFGTSILHILLENENDTSEIIQHIDDASSFAFANGCNQIVDQLENGLNGGECNFRTTTPNLGR